MKQDQKENLKVKSLYRLFATLALILLILAGALTYLSNAIDFDTIAKPFNTLSADARSQLSDLKFGKKVSEKMPDSASASEQIQRIVSADTEKTRNVTGVKKDALEKAQKQTEKKGPIRLIGKAQIYYIEFKLLIEKLERLIEQIPYKPVIVLIIWLLFFLKGFFSITPISFTCFLSGLIFPFWAALLINLVGIVYIFTVKYRKGAKSEKNTIHKYATKWKRLGVLIEDSERGNGTGNPGLLFLLRLAPSIPLNPVSQLYGYMGFQYHWYLAVSLIGYSIKLSSAFLDGTYNGSKSIASLVKDLQEITTKKEVAALYEEEAKPWDGTSYRIALNFHDSRDLLSFLAPGAYIADSTALRLRVTEGGRLTGRITSPRLAFKDKYLRNMSLDLDNGDDALNCTVTGSELSLSRSLILRNDALMLYANDNNVGLGFNFNNMNDPEDRGELYLTGDLSGSSPKKPVLDARSLTSNIYLKGQQWRFDPAAYHYSEGSVEVNGLNISNGEQNFAIDGGVSQDKPDTLMVSINNVDLGLVNTLSLEDLGISGIAYGRAMVTSPVKDKLGLMVNVSTDSTTIAGRPAGTVTFGGSWDLENGLLDYALRNSIDGNTSMDARGYYIPKDKSLGLFAGLEGFDLGYAAPFLKSVFSDIGGKLTGQVSADGPLSSLELEGDDLKIEDGLLKVAFTQVPYYLNGGLHVNSRGVFFDDIAIKDRSDGSGTITGGISYDHFKNIRMDTRIRLNNMEVVDLRESDGEAFYGNVFGTGRVNITGPFSSLLLDVNATTVKGGHFHIPLNGSTAMGGSDLLIFKEPVREVYMDPYELMMNRLVETRKEESDLAVRVRVNATPQVEAHLEVDKATGNVFIGRGAGTIALEVRPSKDVFTINGDYTLNSDHYHFNGMGITSKDFTVDDGSSIKFNGDIMDSDLSIGAKYALRTSLSNLIADTTSVSSRRNVICGVNISDKIRNPKLDFSIDIPDLDPMTKSRVESALSTDDKVQKQFIALLVTNNFIPDEQSGIVNNSNLLTSNVADLMANQLNNILQKLDIPLDLGLNYAESGSGRSIFDVALSTQLFNNRVSVNGSVGNRQYMSSGSGDVVGDLDIEVKMDKSGQVRLNLFSHSADEYTNYLDNLQRNGVGVAYQKEFDSLKLFLRDLFTPKSKRQSQDAVPARDEEKVTIEVEKPE